MLQAAASAELRAALSASAAAAEQTLSAALEAHGRSAQAAAEKQQRLLVAALLRHQRANETTMAATLRKDDGRVCSFTRHLHVRGTADARRALCSDVLLSSPDVHPSR